MRQRLALTRRPFLLTRSILELRVCAIALPRDASTLGRRSSLLIGQDLRPMGRRSSSLGLTFNPRECCDGVIGDGSHSCGTLIRVQMLRQDFAMRGSGHRSGGMGTALPSTDLRSSDARLHCCRRLLRVPDRASVPRGRRHESWIAPSVDRAGPRLERVPALLKRTKPQSERTPHRITRCGLRVGRHRLQFLRRAPYVMWS